MSASGKGETEDGLEGLVPCMDVTEGRSKGKVHPLEQVRSYVVGRLPGAEIHIDDPGVSRRHIKLMRRADGSVDAADMRSTNGLIINGERLERGTLLEGDVISLGPDAALCLTYRSAARLHELSREQGLVVTAAEAPLEPPQPVERAEESTAVIFHRPKLADLPISARQLEVSQLVANGMTNAAIAAELGISLRTVTSHLDHIYSRLSISSRAALTRWIVERGLVRP